MRKGAGHANVPNAFSPKAHSGKLRFVGCVREPNQTHVVVSASSRVDDLNRSADDDDDDDPRVPSSPDSTDRPSRVATT